MSSTQISLTTVALLFFVLSYTLLRIPCTPSSAVRPPSAASHGNSATARLISRLWTLALTEGSSARRHFCRVAALACALRGVSLLADLWLRRRIEGSLRSTEPHLKHHTHDLKHWVDDLLLAVPTLLFITAFSVLGVFFGTVAHNVDAINNKVGPSRGSARTNRSAWVERAAAFLNVSMYVSFVAVSIITFSANHMPALTTFVYCVVGLVHLLSAMAFVRITLLLLQALRRTAERRHTLMSAFPRQSFASPLLSNVPVEAIHESTSGDVENSGGEQLVGTRVSPGPRKVKPLTATVGFAIAIAQAASAVHELGYIAGVLPFDLPGLERRETFAVLHLSCEALPVILILSTMTITSQEPVAR